MRKEFILVLIIVLVAIGGIWYLGQRQGSQNSSSPTNQVPTENGAMNNPQTTPSVSVSDKVDETKNQIALIVSQPTDGQITTSPSVTVMGKTVPNADVTVNDTDLKADTQGNFSTTLTLEDGDNDIIVVAVDDKGQSAEKNLTVTYDSGQ